MLTHEAIVRGSRATGLREQIGSDDVVWDPLPLFHTSGLQLLLYTLDAGARFLCMTHFEAGAALSQIAAHDVTVLKSTCGVSGLADLVAGGAKLRQEGAAADDLARGRVVDVDGLFEQAAEEQAAAARVAAVEPERELVEIEVELADADPALVVPSSQRLRSEAMRWTRGIATCAGSPEAEMFVGRWMNPAFSRSL